MFKLVIAIAVILTTNSYAAEGTKDRDFWVAATIASYHVNRNVKHNENNLGIGLEKGIAPNTKIVVGEYQNSFWRTSRYLGVTYTPFKAGDFSMGVMATVVSGYEAKAVQSYDPVLVPTITYERGKLGANMIFIPPAGKLATGIFGFQVKYKLL